MIGGLYFFAAEDVPKVEPSFGILLGQMLHANDSHTLEMDGQREVVTTNSSFFSFLYS